MAEPDGDTESTEDQNDAVSMLREELTTDYWTPSAQASKALKGHGFSTKQIRTAGKKLNILRKKGAMNEGWYWRLQPKNGRFTEDALFPEDAEDALEKRRGTFGAPSQNEKTAQEGALEDATFKTVGTFGTFEALMATPNCSTYGHPNCSRQDGQINDFWSVVAQRFAGRRLRRPWIGGFFK